MELDRCRIICLLSFVEELLPPVLREDLLEHPALPSLLIWLLRRMKVLGCRVVRFVTLNQVLERTALMRGLLCRMKILGPVGEGG